MNLSNTKNTLRACVVGGGGGGQLSMRAITKSNRFELVAAADITPQVCRTLEEKYPGVQTFTDHVEMFKQTAPDVICVSTWPATHEQVALDALKLPLKGILVEKPLGHTVASGRRVLDAIEAKGLPMAVPHGLLGNETSLEILSRVHNGEIGDLKLVEIQCDKWDIINAGIHWIHFFVSLTGGEPMDFVMALCESSTRTYRDGMQVETTAVTYAQTASGIRVVMQTGDEVNINRQDMNTLFRLVGTQGQIEFWGWDRSYHLLNRQYPSGEMFTPPAAASRGHQYHLEHLAQMIDDAKPNYDLPRNSLLALEICEGAYLSSRHRCKVTFPVDQFTPPAQSDWDPGQVYAGSDGGRNGRTL